MYYGHFETSDKCPDYEHGITLNHWSLKFWNYGELGASYVYNVYTCILMYFAVKT